MKRGGEEQQRALEPPLQLHCGPQHGGEEGGRHEPHGEGLQGRHEHHGEHHVGQPEKLHEHRGEPRDVEPGQ